MGGHGGLNILPNKSWHVWNADSLNKVELDEEKHAAEQAAVQQKQRELEQERHVEKLRRRKGQDVGGGAVAGGGQPGAHVNLFAKEERQQLEKGPNTQNAGEALAQEQRDKRRQGLVLGELPDRKGESVGLPWYVRGGSSLEPPNQPERGAAAAEGAMAAAQAGPLLRLGGGGGRDTIEMSDLTRLLADREEARRDKDYSAADRIRHELKSKGVTLDDRAQTWQSTDGSTGPIRGASGRSGDRLDWSAPDPTKGAAGSSHGDPLLEMRRLVGGGEHGGRSEPQPVAQQSKRRRSDGGSSDDDSDPAQKRPKRQHKKHKRRKAKQQHKKKKKRRSSKGKKKARHRSSSSSSSSSSSDSGGGRDRTALRLERMRQERASREQRERLRALDLMRAKHPGMFSDNTAPGHLFPSGGGGDDGTTQASAELVRHRQRKVARQSLCERQRPPH